MAAANLPVHRDRPGIGPIALSRLVLCEALAAAALLSWYLPSPTPHIVTAACVIMIIAVLGIHVRGFGRRLVRYLRMRRFREGTVEVDTPDDAMTGLAPGLRLCDVTERNTDYGVAFDGTGWFTVLALRYPDPTAPLGIDPATLRTLSDVLLGADRSTYTVQIVGHMVPSPSAEIASDTSCARSYAELLGDDAVVSHHLTWLALRLDGRDAAVAAAERGGGAEGARRALVALTRRLARRLADAGVPYLPLNADSLRVALTHSVSGETISAALHQRAFEEKKSWKLGALSHVVFGVEGRIADIDNLRRLWMSMAVLSTSFSTISVVLRPIGPVSARKGVRLHSLLRVAYDAEINKAAPDELVRAAAECGVKLWRFDGEQASATYASAPTGGGSRIRT